MDRAQEGRDPSELERAVACVDRELRMRLSVYPRWVSQKKLTQRKADEELEGMRLVRRLLISGYALIVQEPDLERRFPPSP